MRTQRRWLLGIAAVLILVALVLFGLGRLGRGPMSQVETTSIEPQRYRLLGEGGDPNVVVLIFPWGEEGFCSGQFRADVTETATEIRVGPVIGRTVHLGACAGLGTDNGMAGVEVFLSAPLGNRRVIRAGDGAELPPDPRS